MSFSTHRNDNGNPPDRRKGACYLLSRLGELSVDGDEPVKSVRQSFRDNLVLWMVYRGLSMSQLATKIGVHKSQVSLWLKGTYFPQSSQVDRLTKALDIPTTFLFWDNSDQRSANGLFQQIVAEAGKSLKTPADMLATVRLLDVYKSVAEAASIDSEGLDEPRPSKPRKKAKKKTSKKAN